MHNIVNRSQVNFVFYARNIVNLCIKYLVNSVLIYPY